MGCCGQNTTGAGATAVDTGKRVNYIKGMLLGDADFVQEQAWHIARRHELTREVLGYGTVRGLKLGVDPDSTIVRVKPGVATMPSGTPVCVPADQCCSVDAWLTRNWDEAGPRLAGPPLPHPLALHVVLAYDSCLTDKVPVPGEPCRSEDQLTVESRIADCFKLELRLDAPYQVEEDAIRDFADWLAHVPVDPVSPPMSEKDFMDQLREAANAWLEPTSPHVGDFMFGSPPPALGSTDALLRAALRLWATELRPVWRARYGCGPNPVAPGGTDDAVLLGTLLMDVDPGTRKVVGEITIDETRRPVLMSLRMVQELIAQNPAPEPAHTVEPETAYAQAPRAGVDTAYARADHSHGTPPLPVLAGEVTGPTDDTVVSLLLGHAFDGAPADGDALALNASGEWEPRHLALPADTVQEALRFGEAADAGSELTDTYSRSDHSHGTPTLSGDVEAVDEEGEGGTAQHVRVVGLNDVPLDTAQAGKPGFVLTLAKRVGRTMAWVPEPLPAPPVVPQPGAVTAQLSFGAVKSDGSSNTLFARADHSHGTPTISGDATTITDTSGQKLRVTGLQGRLVRDTNPTTGQVLSFDGTAWAPANAAGGGPAPGTAAPPGLIFGTLGVAGAALSYARSDHTHGLPALPGLGGDVGGTVTDNRIQRLQDVPVKAEKPRRGDVLTFNGEAWVPQSGGVQVIAAGTIGITVDTKRDATGVALEASNPTEVVTADMLGTTMIQVLLVVGGIDQADGPAKGLMVKLTGMVNGRVAETPLVTLPLLGEVKVGDASRVAIGVLLTAGVALPSGTYRFQFELSRYVPTRGQ